MPSLEFPDICGRNQSQVQLLVGEYVELMLGDRLVEKSLIKLRVSLGRSDGDLDSCEMSLGREGSRGRLMRWRVSSSVGREMTCGLS